MGRDCCTGESEGQGNGCGLANNWQVHHKEESWREQPDLWEVRLALHFFTVDCQTLAIESACVNPCLGHSRQP